MAKAALFTDVYRSDVGAPARSVPTLAAEYQGGSGGSAMPYYDASGWGRRAHGWNPGNAGPNTIGMQSIETLRSRARYTARNDPWAGNGIASFAANAIGTGIKPQSMHPDKTIKAKIQSAWTRWTDQCDAHNACDFYGLQTLLCREVIEGGECFARLRPRRKDSGLRVPLQIQLLESELLPTWYNIDRPNGNKVREGVELNKEIAPAAFWFLKQHPGDTILWPNNAGLLLRVPAQNVSHVFQQLRSGQLRGVPWLAPVLLRIYELNQFEDAELVKQKVAAMFVAVVKQMTGQGMFNEVPGAPGAPAGAAPLGVGNAVMEPGTTQYLRMNEDITFSSPPQFNSLPEFMRIYLRSIAAGLGVTYEQLTGDLTGVNYSSIRAGLIEFWRRCEQFQHQVIIFRFCRPVWDAWIRAALLSGELDYSDYAKDPLAFTSVKWVPPVRQWVDPAKEIGATLKAIRGGLGSRDTAASAQGFDVEEIDIENARDQERADEAGLVYDSNARDRTEAGMPTGESPVRPGQKNKGVRTATPEQRLALATPAGLYAVLEEIVTLELDRRAA
jgi:lambda family phage portal protein